jgi:catechol 2,3-dioxygenase-like lactoylglutathione lyase family enzyme
VRWSAVVLEAPDAGELATFYRDLLGWTTETEESDWVTIRPPGGGTGLSFSTSPEFVRPVWPPLDGEQQMMAHLDLEVDDLDKESARAVGLGASVADFQPQEDVLVHFDPAGHPFCLFVNA